MIHPEYSAHHFALSVRKIEASAGFYSVFGFKLAVQWEAPDGSLRLAHLVGRDGRIIELFEYASNAASPQLELGMGNDLETLGVKHFGLRVSNLEEVHREFAEAKYDGLTEIRHGRTKVDYFFLRDPDGIWVEVVQDDRVVDLDNPTYIRP
jgi:catechol 2,3-dioxygenase-like lactoylglutathione lyase family enzyme